MSSVTRNVVFALLCSVLPGCLFGAQVGSRGMVFGIGSSLAEEGDDAQARGLRIDQYAADVELANNLAARGTIAVRKTVTTPAGLRSGQLASRSFDPKTQQLEVDEAWVLLPGGKRIDVTSAGIFTRPSETAQGAPSFSSSSTTTVVFPQLSVGAQTYVVWKFSDRGTAQAGFDFVYRPALAQPVTSARISIAYPADVPLYWGERGNFDVREEERAGKRLLVARLSDQSARPREAAMVAPIDVLPLFAVTSTASLEGVGAAFHRTTEPAIEVTGEIEELAARIAGDAEGEQAARRIYRWVCRNINYVSIRLQAADSWVPHPASEVLRNGYGDCKDQYVLLASLLRARGVRAEAVLVGWNRSFESLPVPSPLAFDHCIAYLPDFDVYANPTGGFADLGVLDVALANKPVVHATPAGRVARTPAGQSERNGYGVAHELRITREGRIEGHSTMRFWGRPSARVRAMLASSDSSELADEILLRTPEGGTGMLSSSDPTDLDVPLECTGEWASEEALVMGPTVHFTTPVGIDFANPAKGREYITPTERNYPLVITAIQLSWEHRIELPAGYALAELPAGQQIENAAGSFASTYRVDEEGRLRVERKLVLDRDVYGTAEYSSLRELMYALVNDARTILSLNMAPGP